MQYYRSTLAYATGSDFGVSLSGESVSATELLLVTKSDTGMLLSGEIERSKAASGTLLSTVQEQTLLSTEFWLSHEKILVGKDGKIFGNNIQGHSLTDEWGR